MKWADDEFERDHQAYRWLYCEVLLNAFNDILTKDWYEYYLAKLFRTKSKIIKRKIKRHHSAISWLLNQRHELCFEVLGIENISDPVMLKAIQDKFNSSVKFKKISKEFQHIVESRKIKSRKRICDTFESRRQRKKN